MGNHVDPKALLDGFSTLTFRATVPSRRNQSYRLWLQEVGAEDSIAGGGNGDRADKRVDIVLFDEDISE